VWLVAFLVAVVGGALIIAITGYTDVDNDEYPLWLDALLVLPLWIPLIVGTVIVTRRLGTGHPLRDLGVRFVAFDLVGIPLGIATQLVFVDGLYRLLEAFGVDTSELDQPAEELADRADHALWVVVLVLMVVVGAPFVEEIFFRGLLMRSLQARWNDTVALVASAVFFGLVHLQSLQLPGLILFGLVAGICTQRTGRLGMAILAHAAFNATALIGLAVE
jgi:membrane protease YdiL (CAAX protease family)